MQLRIYSYDLYLLSCGIPHYNICITTKLQYAERPITEGYNKAEIKFYFKFYVDHIHCVLKLENPRNFEINTVKLDHCIKESTGGRCRT
jgi:hypothetical protein